MLLIGWQESKIESNPLDRGHQDKITCFKQEVDVILDNLLRQSHILTYPELLTGSGERQGKGPPPPRPTYSPRPGPPPPYYEVTPRTDRSSYRDRGTSHRDQGSSYAGPQEASYVSQRERESGRSEYFDDRRTREYDVPTVERSRSEYVERTRTEIEPAERITIVESRQIAGSQLDPTDPNGVQGLLIRDAQALVDRKIRAFQDMQSRASELETWVRLPPFPFAQYDILTGFLPTEYSKDRL
jgi:hypothetical protein